MANKCTCHRNLVCCLGVDEEGHVELWETIQFWRFVCCLQTTGSIQNLGARHFIGIFLHQDSFLFIFMIYILKLV